jgi:hypothetical protein
MKKLIGLLLITISSVVASDKEEYNQVFSLPILASEEDHHWLVLPAAWILTRRLNKIDYELTQKSPLVKRLATKKMLPEHVWHIVVNTSSEYDRKHTRNECKTRRERCDMIASLLEVVLKDCPEALEELHDYGLYRADERWDGDAERQERAIAFQRKKFPGLFEYHP